MKRTCYFHTEATTKCINMGFLLPSHFSPKSWNETVTRQRRLSIQIIYQSALLNISTEGKQDDEVILNPNTYKGNIKLHIHIPCMCTFMIHMYIHIRKYRARNISMKKSFLFNISNKSFHDVVILLVQ